MALSSICILQERPMPGSSSGGAMILSCTQCMFLFFLWCGSFRNIYIYILEHVYICMCVYMYLSLFLSVFVLNLRTTAAHDLRQYGATLG